MSAAETLSTTPDEDRRAKLKDFLLHCRSRLTPQDVGLPSRSGRRVAGLRRDEIAELAGVSSDWYRWFESGRPIRVSVAFLASLSRALQLNPFEELSLYCLSVPEIYEAMKTVSSLSSDGPFLHSIALCALSKAPGITSSGDSGSAH